MGFDQSKITNVRTCADGADLIISWNSVADPQSIYQVYVDHRLTWFGKAKRCQVPIPAADSNRNLWIDVGVVLPKESSQSFSATLASSRLGTGKATLSWDGGTFLDSSGNDQISGFRIYRSKAPGQPVDYGTPIDDLPAYPGGWISDGFGLGGFGKGGFGRSSSTYYSTVTGLSGGLWSFSVVPYDRPGNLRGPGQSISVMIRTAPLPPGVDLAGHRLKYAYSGAASKQLTLQWLPSPSEQT